MLNPGMKMWKYYDEYMCELCSCEFEDILIAQKQLAEDGYIILEIVRNVFDSTFFKLEKIEEE